MCICLFFSLFFCAGVVCFLLSFFNFFLWLRFCVKRIFNKMWFYVFHLKMHTFIYYFPIFENGHLWFFGLLNINSYYLKTFLDNINFGPCTSNFWLILYYFSFFCLVWCPHCCKNVFLLNVVWCLLFCFVFIYICMWFILYIIISCAV